jgi:hypothetical protein
VPDSLIARVNARRRCYPPPHHTHTRLLLEPRGGPSHVYGTHALAFDSEKVVGVHGAGLPSRRVARPIRTYHLVTDERACQAEAAESEAARRKRRWHFQ